MYHFKCNINSLLFAQFEFYFIAELYMVECSTLCSDGWRNRSFALGPASLGIKSTFFILVCQGIRGPGGPKKSIKLSSDGVQKLQGFAFNAWNAI